MRVFRRMRAIERGAVVSSTRLRVLERFLLPVTLPRPLVLTAVDLPTVDRRRWSPAPLAAAALAAPAAQASLRAARAPRRRRGIGVGVGVRGWGPIGGVGISLGWGVEYKSRIANVVCLVRQERRRVMIAAGLKPLTMRRKRTGFSGISCARR